MKPSFAAVSKGYPRRKDYPQDEVLRLIGWDDLVNNGNYANTCAIRISIALVSAGMSIPGRMSIKKGPHKGRLIEPGQAALSNILVSRLMLGAPEKFKGSSAAQSGVGNRSGIISFWRIHPTWVGDNQGHIDIVSPHEGGYLACDGGCHFGSAEVWFWPLK